MDNPTYEQDSDTQHLDGSFTGLKIVDRILIWLAGLFQLTEKEQKDAGIHLGDKRND